MKDKLDALIIPLTIIFIGLTPFLASIQMGLLKIGLLVPYAPLFASISIIYILKIIFENKRQIMPKKKLTLFITIIALGLIFSSYIGYKMDLGYGYYILALIFSLLNISSVKYNNSLEENFSEIDIGFLFIFWVLFIFAVLNVTEYYFAVNPSVFLIGIFLVVFGIINIKNYYEKTKVRLIASAILIPDIILGYYLLEPNFSDLYNLYIILFSIILPLVILYLTWVATKNWDKLHYKVYPYLKNEKYEEALELLEKGIVNESDNALLWNDQGYAFEKLEKYDEAVKSYDKALKIKPDDDYALYHKGESLINQLKYEEAIDYFNKYLKLKPEETLILAKIGFALGYLNKYNESIKYFDRYLKIYPNETIVNILKARSLNQLERFDEALYIIDRVIKKDPKNTSAWIAKGDILKDSYRLEEALKCYEKTLEIDPSDECYWFDQGLILEELERNNEALQSYEKALELDPEFEEAIEAKEDLESKMKS